MQLTHIDFQRNKGEKPYKFSEYYEKMFSTINHADVKMGVKMIVDLLAHLEEEVDAPSQWVNNSHFDVIFHERDYDVQGKEYGSNVTLQLGLTLSIPQRYSIEAILPESDFPWQFVTGTTDDIKKAAEMIREVLCKQARFWK